MDSTSTVSQWRGEKLKSAAQWHSWYAAMKRYAQNLDVWVYCNPELSRSTLRQPMEMPVRPEIPTLQLAEDLSTAQLRLLKEEYKEEKASWRDDMDLYKLSLAEYKEQQKGLRLVDQAITNSIEVKLQRIMDRLETPYERLRFLYKRFARSNSYNVDVLLRWREEDIKGPKKGANVLQWLEDWELLREEVIKLQLESDTFHSVLFLKAVKEVLPVWWEARYQQIVIESQPTNMVALLDSFRASYTETRKTAPAVPNSKPAFATSTWQGHKEAKPGNQAETFIEFKDRRVCPCGGFHAVADCWSMNPTIRPEGWKVADHRQAKINKAFGREPEWKIWVENEIKNKGGFGDQRSANLATTEASDNITTYTGFSTMMLDDQYRDQWVMDSGASVHVCNDRTKFIDYKENKTYLRTGNGQTPALGVGTAIMTGIDPVTGVARNISLSNCLYSPSFHCNLVSLARVEEKGGWWNTKKGWVIDNKGVPVMVVYRDPDQDIYLCLQPRNEKSNDGVALATRRQSEKPLISSATASTWHRRLGHVYQGAIGQLPYLVNGVEIKNGSEGETELCEVCNLVNAPRQISRRPIGKHYGRYGRVYFDLIPMTMGYNQHCWITHFYVEGIHFHWTMTHVNKNGCQEAIQSFVAFAIKWLQLPIKVWHSDNEKSVDMRIHKMIDSMGCIHTFTVPYSPEMNGPGERSGGVLIKRARALLKEGKLPEKLWPEAINAAVYLLNRTPTRVDGKWIIPWEEARKFIDNSEKPKTSLSNVRLYGSLAYCRIPTIPRLNKMQSRAEVGYLVGFVASNIWKIWMPHRGQVRMVRDAVFDESRRFSAEIVIDEVIQMPVPQATPPKVIEQDMEIESILQGLSEQLEVTGTNDALELSLAAGGAGEYLATDEPTTPTAAEEGDQGDTEKTDSKGQESYAHTPPRSPNGLDSATDQGVGYGNQNHEIEGDLIPESPISIQSTTSEADDDTTESPVVNEEVISGHIDGLDVENIVIGPRIRKQRRDEEFAYKTALADDDTTPVSLQAFATGLFAPKPTCRQHRDDLPPPPERFKDVWKHPLSDGFSKAMRVELDGLQAKSTYQEVETPKDRGIQVLPLMWVYAYKFDQDGFLLKCKARICVRGDLQTISSEEKRAATLAARTARTLFALVAAYDLDLRQRDAVNAFLNSKLRSRVYTLMPEGYKTNGRCWLLHRALYGLRIAPRLWQQDAAAVLRKLGLEQVAEDPCVFVGEGIIVFFYVDDILIASHRMAKERARQLERELEKHWHLTDQGDAEWFLGIRILRNRIERKLWLVQDSYLAGVAERYKLTGRAPVYTPAGVEPLQAYEGQATPQEIHAYQQKVGSVQYSTTITRADAAKVASVLSQFMTNPGPKHQAAVDRLIVYLYTTRFMAIEFGPVAEDSEVVKISSDASYADHSDRKSSAGYICQIFGGPVDWKATKQRTVTTSTTEAELLGLSDAGKALQWWDRLFTRIGFQYPQPLTIECDNSRTIALINAEDTPFDTKLRHVDIHGHWLRQEVKDGRIRIKWVPTAQMIADGLTKVLPRQKHTAFVKMLGLRDVRHLIELEDGN
ncbi:hypothetical protein N7499_003084 [Penicillium canescens]|nr:hypothetical protein N7499_003823 [Penicillium canescens]KAJ6093753.1 hypothetical protein N7499_003084 [Penicillium canescens]KAJ6154137.1 hypothetical protein N7485_012506 [Penicillium canescens]KAJ6181514.1 hypothetical protein N7485_000156 [Penicillium canescens]KAJ6181772.1 hypothetical protein N7485_000414 [Penicillium canescens]